MLICFLTHWDRVTHICVGKLTIIVSDKGLSPARRQVIIWNNAGILFIGPLGTNFSEILIEIHTFSFKKMHFKMSSGKWRPFCLGLNVLMEPYGLWTLNTCINFGHHYACWWPSTDNHKWIESVFLFSCPPQKLCIWSKMFTWKPGVCGAVRFLGVGTIGQEERPPRGQLWVEQCLTSLKYWPI